MLFSHQELQCLYNSSICYSLNKSLNNITQQSMSSTPDLAGSFGCRTLPAPFLSQQDLKLLLCPASQVSLMGKPRQPWLPLLQQKWVCIWSEPLFSRSFPFAGKCFAFSVSSFQLSFPWVMLGSEVVTQPWWAGIQSCRKDSPSVSLLCCQVQLFNDLAIAGLHFCLCKLTWSLTAAAWGERENPAASERSWVRMATLQGKQLSLPDRLFFYPGAFIPPCRDGLFMGNFAKNCETFLFGLLCSLWHHLSRTFKRF